MIQIMESMLGYTFGETSYDDILVIGAFTLGIMAILMIIAIFKYILR